MIFSKKIYKIVSGKNLTFYPENENEFSTFVYDNITKKYFIKIGNTVKSGLLNSNLAYNQITKLNDKHSCVCYDKNISIINNEKQNI